MSSAIDLKLGQQGVLSKVRLVIFDKDGTLIELYRYWSAMVGLRARLIVEKLGIGRQHLSGLVYAMGIDSKAAKLRSCGPVGIKKREIVMQAALDYLFGIGRMDVHKICLEAFEEADRLSLTDLERFISPLPGAMELINALHQEGCKVAVATTDKFKRAKLAIDFLGLTDKVSLIIGSDQVNRPKPHPDSIEIILDKLKVSRANAVMVGDALSDLEMGLSAGLKAAIGVATGISSRQELLRVTPYVVGELGLISLHKTDTKELK